MAQYPSELDKYITDQDINAITSLILPIIPQAVNDNTKLQILQSIIYRLLDPEQKYDEIVELEELITIAIGCVDILRNLTLGSTSDEVLSNATNQATEHIQGLILWLATNSGLMLIGDLVQNEKIFLKNPTTPIADVPEKSTILTTIQSIITSFSFINNRMRELNYRFHVHHLQYSISYQYYLHLTAICAYYNDKYSDACLYYQRSSSLCTTLLQLIPTTFSIPEKLILLSFGPYYTLDKFQTYLIKNEFNHYYESLKLLPILPQSKQKIKLLSTLVSDSQFESCKNKIDTHFISTEQYAQCISTVASTLIPKQEQYTTLLPLSLTTIINKLNRSQLLTKYELATIAVIYKTPFDLIKELTFPNTSTTSSTSTTNTSSTMNDNNNNDDNDSLLSLPFQHRILATLLEHNIISVGKFISSINFTALSTLLGLDPIHAKSIEELIRLMILSTKLPSSCHINSIHGLVTFYDLKQNPQKQANDIIINNNQLLKEIYDTHLNSVRFVK